MKLSIKLPLAFAVALTLLLAGALFGVYQLNRVVATCEDDVLLHVAAHKKGAEVGTEFALAIQEWKNVLLRGKDPKELDKYWASHVKAMDSVNAKLDELATLLAKEDEAPIVAKLKTEMAGAREGYAKALEQYKAANMDFEAGDKAAKGKDRAAATLLKDLQERLSKAETASSQEAEALAKNATRISVVVMLVVTAVALAGSIVLSRSIVTELAKAVGIAGTVAKGDLTHPIEVSGDKEVADLLQSLKDMQAHLIGLVSHVRQGAEGVATASKEIAMGNHDLSMRTEQQASALQQTASSMEELSTTVGHSADNARQASQLATGASSVATRGGEVMGQVVETMRGINEASRKIADIISVIDGIAFQTNILALNAAVEAARAGEQGRGFAVVASEVRALAGRSAEAAKEIKSLIGTSVERVEHGSALVDQAGNTMTEVVSAIRRVTDIVGEISAASSQQNAGVSEVRDAVQRIDTATQQNAALVEEMAAAASGLQGQADELVREVSTFKLNAQDDAGVQRAQVRMPAPAAKPFQGEERRTVAAPPKPAAAAKPSAPASAPKALAAAPKPAAAAPKKAAAAADDEWETF